MAYRTGTYFAFDGLGQADPTKSDFKYYATVQGWNANKGVEFKFANSHEKASAVRDSSKVETLKASIRQRLAASKNMVVILSRSTRKSGSMLSYEIEKAVDRYQLPLIVAYTGYDAVVKPDELSFMWPNTLTERIRNRTAQAIHIPFRQAALFNAISRFTVNGESIGSPLQFYSWDAHKEWGYV
ncbi:MAG: TIR domain-containing protein [Pseudomonadota bacterium]